MRGGVRFPHQQRLARLAVHPTGKNRRKVYKTNGVEPLVHVLSLQPLQITSLENKTLLLSVKLFTLEQ